MIAGRLCGLAVIVVVLAPLLAGFAWPSGTETVDVWDVEPAMDVTGDLANKPIPVYGPYTGPLNNLSIFTQQQDAFVFPVPRATTTTPNAYPVSEITSTEIVQSVTLDASLSGIRYGFGSYRGFVYSGDGETYSYGDFWPKTNVLILYDSSSNPVKTVTPAATDTLDATDLTQMTFGPSEGYIDITQGLAGSAQPWIWVNGMHNKSVELWVRMANTPFTNTVHIADITLTRTGGMVAVSDGTTTGQLGSAYSYISILMTEDDTTVTGLIGAETFTDPTWSAGNRIALSAIGDLDHIVMSGSYIDWWVKATESAISSVKGIKDSTLVPDSLYPGAWQVQIINPSAFGSALTISDGTQTLRLPIVSGQVDVQNIATSETGSVPVRGLTVLSLVLGGEQRIYINGTLVMNGTPSTHSITLEGEWYTSVVLSKVTQSTATSYTWDFGQSYGFDQTSFCVVGLLSCVAVAIAGSVWGRSSGSSVLALHITMILCGIAYLVLL